MYWRQNTKRKLQKLKCKRMSLSNLGFKADVCINCTSCETLAHFFHVHLLSRLWVGDLSPQRSKSSPQFLLPFSPKPMTDTEETEREGLWEQRPDQAFLSGVRNSFPCLFWVSIPKRWLCNWVLPHSLPHPSVRGCDEAGAKQTGHPALWPLPLPYTHDTYNRSLLS